MIKVKFRLVIIVLMVLIILSAGISSLTAQPKTTRQSSLEAFTKGEYELAYRGFGELLVSYPKDPLYKYYSGVCLVNLGRDAEKALLLLEQALQGSVVVKSVPSDAVFWLGRAQQMTGRFDEAIRSFDAFTLQYGKKAARDLGVPAFAQQCHDRKGRLADSDILPVANRVQETHQEETVEEVVVPQAVDLPPVGQSIDTLPGNFDIILSEALEFQFKADSLYRITDELKKNLNNPDYKEKAGLKTKISDYEALATEYQKKADQKYGEAQTIMNSSSFAAVDIPDANNIPQPDSSAEKKIEEVFGKDSTSGAELKSEPVKMIIKSVESFSVFETDPSDAVSTEKLPVNEAVPPGLIYRIQVAVFRNPVTRSYFKGITPVYGFRLAGNNYTTYYAGMFRRVADARKALTSVKQKGFKDAFIVALSGGKAVSMERATLLEKEWGLKPFILKQEAAMTPADTIPPELCFRIEVVRSVKPLKQEVLDGMTKIAGTKGVDIETTGDGSKIYLIGKFITYNSALTYADLLLRNGFRDAKVVARLGKKEVPVETARSLFEKVE